jgi:uncharacterized protein
MDPYSITSLEQLRELYPEPKQRTLDKEIDHLDDHCRRFLSLSPFAIVCSANADGRCDASPKGGPPGFVRVLDEHRLLIPDARGNRRVDGFQNMFENPRVGVLFLIPGMGETLRVNGSVELSSDPALLDGLETGGHDAQLALIVHAEEVFIHCAKSLIRSRLWDPDSWAGREELPSAAEILNDHIGIGDVEASAAALADGYRDHL